MNKFLTGIALALGLASSASASIVIQFDGLAIEYLGNALGTSGELFDRDEAVAGIGAPTSQVTIFNIDDTTGAQSVVTTLPNARVDFHFTLLPGAVNGVLTSGTSDFFRILAAPYSLDLLATGVGVIAVGPTVNTFTLTDASIRGQVLPFGVTFDDTVAVSMTGTLLPASIVRAGPNFISFDALATGSAGGPGQVPEPALLGLIGIGLLGLGLSRSKKSRA